MKANLVEEPESLKFWEEKRTYEKVQEKNRNGRHYILHDGPPYANGHIHIGHALNRYSGYNRKFSRCRLLFAICAGMGLSRPSDRAAG